MPSSFFILSLVFLLSVGFAWAVRYSNFCAMGAVSDIFLMGNWDRMAQWGIAAGLAILGTSTLQIFGVIDLSQSLYRAAAFNPAAAVLGGMVFGVGMVLSSGCALQALLNTASGSLKSFVVCLIIAMTALMTDRGIFAFLRTDFLSFSAFSFPDQGLPALLMAHAHFSALFAWGFCLLVSIIFLGVLCRKAAYQKKTLWLGGFFMGFFIIAAWFLNAGLAYLPEDPETLQGVFLGSAANRPEALAFVAPDAATLNFMMQWTDRYQRLHAGIVSVLGVITGSALWALRHGSFRVEGFHGKEDTLHHLVGAALMGVGGVTALGCTVGQGLSGISTLAASAFLSTPAMILGAYLTLRWQYQRA